MIVDFNVAEMNRPAFDEKSQVSFILKSLPKSSIQFCINVKINQIEFQKGSSFETKSAPSSFRFKKIQKKKGWKRKRFAAAVKSKGKVKETSSFKQLKECEVTLKVGTGDVISARAV
ncbi:gag/pol protein [Cucumis melo var. makuwa]|uniref:Gag/pol protein n=1 Tax=Cucumis melo var. makuwa TaxID=1194695 RepID=A0A5D3CXF9_CUCMM|nr:gag/pol protein [Cucumis melo var. makuwa]TYK15136.1 gag/pol protein [Cucumis melo var. makuwa]